MSFTASHVMSTWLKDAVSNAYTTSYRITADTIKLALFNLSCDSTVASTDTLAHNAYLAAGGQFVTGNEITGTNWAAGGIALGTLATTTATSGTALMHWSAANTSTASVTITSSFYGCGIYDATTSSTTADEILCMVYFGGAYTVGGGTLAINWGNDSNGSACIFYITI